MNSVVLSALFCLAAAVTVSGEVGYIQIRNEGGYVARAYAEWEINGKQESEDSGDFLLGRTEVMKIPDGAKNIFLKVYNYVFFGATSQIFSETFTSPPKKCYKVWGTTLIPGHASVEC